MDGAVQAFGAASALSSALLAETIDVSIRTALKMLDEMTAIGLLREITGRRTVRIWVVPGLGARLAAWPSCRAARRMHASIPPIEMGKTARCRNRAQREASVRATDCALAALYAALGHASALVIDTLRRRSS